MLKTKEEIKGWLDGKQITSYTINEDLSVDVNANVQLSFKAIQNLPVQFGIVKGSFSCTNNNLKTLKGSPRVVIGDFNCSSNKLESLVGGPQEVGKIYNATKNKLISLEGIALKIGDDAHFGFNKLTTLSDVSCSVAGHFYCHHNQIKELGNFEIIIGKDFVHQTSDDEIVELRNHYSLTDELYRESESDKGVIMSGKNVKALTLYRKMEKEIEDKANTSKNKIKI